MLADVTVLVLPARQIVTWAAEGAMVDTAVRRG
jgi:hypothetical protein